MPTENNSLPTAFSRRRVKVIAFLVAAVGLADMAGWIFNVNALKNFASPWITMKFTTSFAFILSGIILYFIARSQEGESEKSQIVLSLFSLALGLLMGVLFISTLFNIRTGIEDLFITDPGGGKCVVAGRPSLPTMVNFILIAFCGILAILNPVRLALKLKVVGWIIGSVGSVALLGYVFNQPLFSYYLPGINSAMALPTAVLFVLWGAGLACL